MKPELTKQQRGGLLAVARLLDRVPRKKFKMTYWVIKPDGTLDDGGKHSPKECGFAGCAIGWGMTLPRFKGFRGMPYDMMSALGVPYHKDYNFGPGKNLFGGHRKNVTPKRVAKDIRKYLEDGTLPSIHPKLQSS